MGAASLEFEINFVPQRAIKGQALANFLADHPMPAEWELTEEFPDEEIFLVEVLPPWEIYFDGAARRNGAGAGVLFVSPKKDLLPYSFVLSQICSNNEAEYQAILLGLEFKSRNSSSNLSRRYAGELLPKSRKFHSTMSLAREWASRRVAGIAASLARFDERPNQVPICERWVIPPPLEEEKEEEQTRETKNLSPISASQNQTEDRCKPIINFLRHKDTPKSTCESEVQIRQTAPRYIFINDVLYRRSYEGLLLLRRLSKEEGLQVLKETHGGICGAHQAGPAPPTSQTTSATIGQLCSGAPSKWLEPANRANSMPITYINHRCRFTQRSLPGHSSLGYGYHRPYHSQIRHRPGQYILAATDYFSKWAEAAAYREVKATTVVDFIRTQIIYRYGVPRYIVTDNGTPFRNKVMDRLCEKFRIQQRMSSAYNPAANGLAEAFNKTLCKILKKTVNTHKRSWDEKLPEALWAYRTTARTPTQSTPYSLVYGSEAVLPLEVQLPSLRIAVREGLTTEECAQLRLAELESLDE
ncbi:hypothetical protein H6P81_013754 [Aristolochia fimbriata]|uniref:Integrase catalytic domain-containing protein n=1 Tax=Aristolochia fimbriata TaxID=158543 RepID=A0AAV7EIE1_ARIFI|nr:hypothetical protein H6P81_013754 [Aristolochia fimbriata]